MTNAIYNQTFINNNLYQRELSKKNQNQNEESSYLFDDLIHQHPNIPELTAILGKSGDLPILFDLEDPRPGSILIVNDHLPSVRKLMLVMMKSLAIYSQSTSLQFITISHYPEKWMETIQVFDPQYSFCAGVSGDYENSAADWIHYLAKKADDRLSGRNHGPAAILFIDDCELINHLDIQARLNYEWLLSNGASSRIWIISGLDLRKNHDLLNPFDQYKTKIFGHVDREFTSINTKLMPSGILEQLNTERNFATKIGSNWVRFWAPKLQG